MMDYPGTRGPHQLGLNEATARLTELLDQVEQKIDYIQTVLSDVPSGPMTASLNDQPIGAGSTTIQGRVHNALRASERLLTRLNQIQQVITGGS